MASPQFITPVIIDNVSGEDMTGVIDGANNAFQTQYVYADGSLTVFLNGLQLREGATRDYILDPAFPNQGILLNEAPLPGDGLFTNYRRFVQGGPGC